MEEQPKPWVKSLSKRGKRELIVIGIVMFFFVAEMEISFESGWAVSGLPSKHLANVADGPEPDSCS